MAWLAAVVVALLYPIPFERSGQIYYETVGFLVLLNAMLGIGWNIIGGWAGQFDFGPSIFFAIGAYTAALLSINLGWNAWLALPARWSSRRCSALRSRTPSRGCAATTSRSPPWRCG